MVLRQYELHQTSCGSYDILIYLDPRRQTEFALPPGEQTLLARLCDAAVSAGSVMRIRSVKVIVAGALIATVPFSSFAARAKGQDYAMSYVYFGSAADQIKNITRSAHTLDMVSPSYFDLNADGTLKLNAVSESFLSAMKKQGLRVVPFLSNHWNREKGRAALRNADKLVGQIKDAVYRYQLDGVNVDIENVTHEDRDLYTAFVRKLRAALPKDKEVSVAVAANPMGYTLGWHGSYDYAALAKHADYLFIMTYDEHYQGGPAGPVASLDFVEQSLAYALRYADPQKIVLGLPFFGRIWSADGRVNGLGLSLTTAEEFKKTYHGVTRYDAEAQSPQLTFTIKASDPKPTVNGVKLPAGHYTLWYENADSLKQKLSLVNKYGIKGVGNWSAGQETADVWDYYGLWLGGKYFSDIQGYFAQDEIIKITSDGIMKGMTETTFAPSSPLTRAQAAVIIARTLELDGSGGDSAPFSDVTGHWAKREIGLAASAGLIKGYEDGAFRPEQPVTRAEMSVMLSRMLESTFTRVDPPFVDVGRDHWAASEITALASADILRGYEDGTFRPSAQVTRGEVAVLLDRLRDNME